MAVICFPTPFPILLRYPKVQLYTVLYHILSYCALPYLTASYCTVPYCIVLYHTVPYLKPNVPQYATIEPPHLNHPSLSFQMYPAYPSYQVISIPLVKALCPPPSFLRKKSFPFMNFLIEPFSPSASLAFCSSLPLFLASF